MSYIHTAHQRHTAELEKGDNTKYERYSKMMRLVSGPTIFCLPSNRAKRRGIMRKLLAARQPPSRIDHPNVQASHLQMRQTNVTSGELYREVLQMSDPSQGTGRGTYGMRGCRNMIVLVLMVHFGPFSLQ